MCKRLGLFTVIFVLMFSAIPFTMAESDCDFSYSNHARGAQLLDMGDVTRALHHYECALEQDSDSDILLLSIGNIYRDMEDMTTAQAYYDRLTTLDAPTLPSDANCDYTYSNHARGAQLLDMRDYSRALHHYECALAKDPDNQTLLLTLSNIYGYMGDRANATAYYDRAKMDDACDTTISQFAYGSQLHAMGDLGRAIEAYHCELTQDPTRLAVMIQLAQAYTQVEDYDAALMYLNRALQLDDDLAVLYSQRGYVHYMMGDLQGALIDLNVALEINPNLQDAQRTRAWVLSALGEVETVSIQSPISKNALPQLDISSDDGDALTMMIAEVAPSSASADTVRQAAEDLFNAYEFELAITQYEALLGFEPNNAYAHYRIGYANYALENPTSALIYLQQADSLNPDDLYTQYFLAMTYSMLDMRQDALKTMSDIYEDNPYNRAFPIAMGHVYRHLGHNEAAAAEFNRWLSQIELLRIDIEPVEDRTPTTLVMDYGIVYEMPFYAVAGDTVHISAESSILNRKPIDPLILVLNTDGSPIAGDDDTGNLFDASLSFIAPSTGQYKLLVSHAGGHTSGDLKLTVSGMALSADMFRTLAQYAINDADYERAIDMINKALVLDGGSYQDYMTRGNAYFGLENYTAAIEDYYLVLDLNPDHADAYMQIERIRNLMRNSDTLNEFAEPAQPSSADKLVEFGFNLLAQNKRYSAAQYFFDALLIDPNLDAVRCELGLIYSAWGNHRGALEQYNLVQSDPCADRNRATTNQKLEELIAIQNSYVTINPVQPSPADDMVALGYDYLANGKNFSAAHAFRDALLIDSSLDTVRCELSNIYTEWGNYVGALNQIKLVSDHPCAEDHMDAMIEKMGRFIVPMTAQDYVNMAEAHEANAEWKLALDDYQQALKLDPTLDYARCKVDVIGVHVDFDNYANGLSHFETMFDDSLDQSCTNNVDHDEAGLYNDQFLSLHIYDYPLPDSYMTASGYVDALYDELMNLGDNALVNEAQIHHENGEEWLASALLDRYIDEHFSTKCSRDLRELAIDYGSRGYMVMANMLHLKSISDSTC